ncbi:MAG: glycosyltransferase family 4 protein [Polyangiaceae bacterium]|nr:glycosyltransferase family 4 protein [Polyangiaceae bacterium]
MRVLHLTTDFPWPATSGGSVRTVSQLRILASLPEVQTITMLSVAENPVDASACRALANAIPKLSVVPPVFHPVHLFDFARYVPRVVALRALRGVPYLAGKWDSRVLRQTLRRELHAAPIDVVYIDHLGMARYLPEIKAARPNAHLVLDQHNVESDFFKQFAERQTGPKKLIAWAEHRASVRFEKRALRGVNAVVAISKEDASHFTSLAHVHAEVVPMVLPFERRTRPDPGKPNLCYVGNLRWRPNVEGLDWFCKEVWPLVRARTGATLQIAGIGLKPDASGTLPVPDAWRTDGVEVLGFVEDLEPLYARSIAMIAPVIGGSGVRVKLLEGFRAGMPIITTPDGAFGLTLTDGREALIAKEPHAFADRIERIVTDCALRDQIRNGAYSYLDEHHSLAVAQKIMRRVLGLLSI